MPTDFAFTGQRHDTSTGLYFFHARYYHSGVGRFVSADTIVPEPGNPQALNRYSYVYNNTLRYTDPDGHGVKEWLEKKAKQATELLLQKTGSVIDSVWDWGTDRLPDGKFKSTAQALGVGVDWFFETDSEVQWFGPDEPLTQDVRFDPAVKAFHKEWAAEGHPLPFSRQHQMDKREGALAPRIMGGAKAYAIENIELGLSLVGLGSSSPQGSIDAVGGVLGSFDRISVLDAGDGMVKFEVYNVTGLASGTRIPGTNLSLFPDRERSDWGPGGSVHQYFYWWEEIYQGGELHRLYERYDNGASGGGSSGFGWP